MTQSNDRFGGFLQKEREKIREQEEFFNHATEQAKNTALTEENVLAMPTGTLITYLVDAQMGLASMASEAKQVQEMIEEIEESDDEDEKSWIDKFTSMMAIAKTNYQLAIKEIDRRIPIPEADDEKSTP